LITYRLMNVDPGYSVRSHAHTPTSGKGKLVARKIRVRMAKFDATCLFRLCTLTRLALRWDVSDLYMSVEPKEAMSLPLTSSTRLSFLQKWCFSHVSLRIEWGHCTSVLPVWTAWRRFGLLTTSSFPMRIDTLGTLIVIYFKIAPRATLHEWQRITWSTQTFKFLTGQPIRLT
jgi:hypothetical protein